MARYIQEYFFDSDCTITIPSCAKFLGVEKCGKQFVLLCEIWGNPNLVYDINLKIIRKDEYIHPEAKLLGYCLVGSNIFHFIYTEGEVIDLGSDGGLPDTSEESLKPKSVRPDTSGIKLAGGMKEI